jgi:signal transduction histidine kinase
MSRWLQRSSIFVLIAGLIVGGLGWATAAALRMEDNHRHMEAQKDRAEKMGRALLRLDGVMASPLARENSRPFDHFTPLHSPFPAMTQQGVACAPGSVRVPSPLMSVELQPWMLLHFQYTPGNRGELGWQSPQVLKAAQRAMLQKEMYGLTLANVTPEREELLTLFRSKYPSDRLVAEIRRQVGALAASEPAVDDNRLPIPPSQPNPTNPTKDGQSEWNKNAQAPNAPAQNMQQAAQQYAGNSEFPARREVSNATRYTPKGGRGVDPDVSLDAMTAPKSAVIGDVHLTPMTPVWFPSADQPDYLLYARLARFGPKELVQGVIVDWPQLRGELQEKVQDLFPDSRLSPLPDDADPNADNVMTALPARLDTGPTENLPPAGWTPLRLGLGVAWSAVLLALVAMGLSAYSLIDLSERRIRFVSAVTHELRTPLTTLRLYLDMLTSGLVRDPEKKEEYLRTLNTESERLHRLISNVLDFARLEKQSARPAPTDIVPADLLEQIKAAWQSRCDGAGKQLVVENGLNGQTLHTDGVLVQQILGNLIDNACKYSQSASDRRLWLRAAPAETGRVAFEVEDCGPGVARRESRSIFRAFRRGEGADVTAGGVGLGLALATRWAAMLGGRLDVRRGTNAGGACFRLELPA